MSAKKNEFVRETIKEKPINKKRVGQKILLSAGCAVVFAIILCLAVAFLVPVILEKRGLVISNKNEINETENTEEPSTDSTEEVEPDHVEIDLTVEDYQKIRTQLYSIGKKANKSVVQITSVTNATDVFNSSYESESIGSGIIISKTGNEYLILTEYSLISGTTALHVTFVDETEVEATVKNYDKGSGLAVLSVSREQLDKDTESRIAAVVRNKKTMLTPGSIVIAIGSPQGDVFSIMAGDLISHSNTVSAIDHVYNVITTNIPSYNKGTGVLINISGEVVGIIMHDYNSDEGTSTISAIPMTQAADLIDCICTGNSVPYLGLNLVSVTSKLSSEMGLPAGAYIEEIETDSPAKTGTLQVGDVITQLNGETVSSVKDYSEALLSCKVGQEVEIIVMRKGKTDYTEMKITLTIGEKK